MPDQIERLEYIEIDRLTPYANNARTHSREQIEKLRASIKEFGFINPILIDKDCGIIAGHGRIEAAKLEGMAMVPCIRVEHLTEAQKRAYIIADNRLALDAGWDYGKLEIEFNELNDVQFDLDFTGFNSDEIKEIRSAGDALDLSQSVESGAGANNTKCPKCGFEYRINE